MVPGAQEHMKQFEAELILVDPKENVKAEDDEKIDAFCQRLKKDGKDIC